MLDNLIASVRTTGGIGMVGVYVPADPGEGRATPSFLVSHELGLDEAAEGYQRFDKREDGWAKVLLRPGSTA